MGTRVKRRIGEMKSEYAAWWWVCRVCTVPGSPGYDAVGGRGVRVCARWLGGDGFANFLTDVGPRPTPGHRLRRIGPGDYGPANCRWALAEGGSGHLHTDGGVTRTVGEWARIYDVWPQTLAKRLKAGQTLAEAVEIAARPRRLKRLYRGEEWTTAELSAVAGVPRATILGRLATGWSVEDAVETPPRAKSPRRRPTLPYRGGERTLAELEAVAGVPADAITTRVRACGWSVEDAAEIPVGAKRPPSKTPPGLGRRTE